MYEIIVKDRASDYTLKGYCSSESRLERKIKDMIYNHIFKDLQFELVSVSKKGMFV